jgi:hypothetical protein
MKGAMDLNVVTSIPCVAGVNEGPTMGLQYSSVAAVPRSHASGVVGRRDGGT